MYYMIVEAATVEGLQAKVNNCIKAGYIPQGSMCTSSARLYQAMTYEMKIKDEKQEIK